MNDQPVLRPATRADGPAIIDLWHRCDLVVPHNPPQTDFTRAMVSPHAEIFVVHAPVGVVGSVMVGEDGHRAWVYYLAVNPEVRKQGLGEQLMAAAEAWADARGARKIQLMIRPGNAPVREFYAATGYAETPRLVMAKWLDKDMGLRP
ncbi:MAG: GNAT family acetyltransferase [Pseudomonadota bacterium]